MSSFRLRFTSFSDSLFLVTVSDDTQCFFYHCRFGYLNKTLKNYLYSLEVPSDHLDLRRDIESNSQLMFNVFDVLSREVWGV